MLGLTRAVDVSIVSPVHGSSYIPGAPIRISLAASGNIRSEWLACCGTRWLRKCAPVSSTGELFLELRDSTMKSSVRLRAWMEDEDGETVAHSNEIVLRVPKEFSNLVSPPREAHFFSDVRDWHASRSRDLAGTVGCNELNGFEHSCQCPAIDSESRTMVCNSPKAMSKVIKVVLRKLANATDYYDMQRTFSCPTPDLLLLTDVATQAARRVLEAWTKFVFVRDPFTRLVSFYRDFDNRPVPIDKTSTVAEHLSFPDFVRRVASVRDDEANEHVASQAYLCGLDTVQYDIVGIGEPSDAAVTKPFISKLCRAFGRSEEFCTVELEKTNLCEVVNNSTSLRCFSRNMTSEEDASRLDLLYSDQQLYHLVTTRYRRDLDFISKLNPPGEASASARE